MIYSLENIIRLRVTQVKPKLIILALALCFFFASIVTSSKVNDVWKSFLSFHRGRGNNYWCFIKTLSRFSEETHANIVILNTIWGN